MPAVQKLCSSGILLQNGTLTAQGSAHEIVDLYLSQIPGSIAGEVDLRKHPARRQGAVPLLQGLRILDHQGRSSGSVVCGKNVTLQFRMICQGKPVAPYVGIGFDDINETRVFSITTNLSSETLPAVSGEVSISCTIPDLPLAPGHYRLSLSAGNFHQRLIDALDSAITLTVSPSDFFGCGEIPDSSLGCVMVRSAWKLDRVT
jgi:hypothetical protein